MSAKDDEHSVFIGKKPFMNYVTGVVMQFTTKGAKEVAIKARGRYIAMAVDVAEACRRKFLKEHNLVVKNVRIGSEEVENMEGRKMNVSTIEVVLSKY